MNSAATATEPRASRLDRWKTVRWWRSISSVLQHNPTNLIEFIEGRIADLDAAWDARFEETSERLTSFVTGLERDRLGSPSDETFLRVAEKYRRRELRALLMAHLATEVVSRAQARAQPILDALSSLDPDDHLGALDAGDFRGFDELSRELFPDRVVKSVGSAVDEAVATRSTGPVDDLITEVGVSRVDDEFRNLLAFDRPAVAQRLEQELARRTTTVDLRGDDPVVRLADTDEPIVDRSGSRAARA